MTCSGTSHHAWPESHRNGPSDRNRHTLGTADSAPPSLSMNPNRSKAWFRIGCVVAILDISIMPVVYFYALRYGTSLSLQNIFAVITGVFGLFCFIHYALRSFRLFLRRKLMVFGPLGWTRWGLLEFLNVNIAIIMFLVEVELIIGTAPKNPILRLCAMTSATACYYLGFLFLFSSIMTSIRCPLPFNMSSTSKGSPWRPALYGFAEDFIANEMRGGKASREQMMRRYETSAIFRRMIQVLSWYWGLGFLIVAVSTTVLAMLLPESVVFGIGWGAPYLCFAVMAITTAIFVKWSLRRERDLWEGKVQYDRSSIGRSAP